MAKDSKKSKHRKEGKGTGGGRSDLRIGISIGSDSKKRGGCVSGTTIGISIKKKRKKHAVARTHEDDM